MRDYIERAKDFIQQIFPYIHDFESPWQTRMDIGHFNNNFSRRVILRSGCARIALITSDYVVKWDYDEDEVDSIGGCENEVSLYATAEQEGFAYLFAKITPFYYNEHRFYIMPRVRNIRESNGRAWQYMTPAEKAWCEKHYLTDLHCNNYGMTNGKITIVDYAFQTDSVEETSYYSSSSDVSES